MAGRIVEKGPPSGNAREQGFPSLVMLGPCTGQSSIPLPERKKVWDDPCHGSDRN